MSCGLTPSSWCTFVCVNFCVTPLWHLPAGRIQVGLVDRRVGIARGQNIVHPVAARAVGRNHRPTLRRQPVIAVQVARNPVPRKPKLLRQPHSLMAPRQVSRDRFCSADRRVRIRVRLDRVDPVAIRAHRRQPIPARNALPVNALHERVVHVCVALAAGRRHIELVDRRFLIVRRQYLVRAMAIGAHRRLLSIPSPWPARARSPGS